jgi:hypothetical protein
VFGAATNYTADIASSPANEIEYEDGIPFQQALEVFAFDGFHDSRIRWGMSSSCMS